MVGGRHGVQKATVFYIIENQKTNQKTTAGRMLRSPPELAGGKSHCAYRVRPASRDLWVQACL